MFLNLLSNAVKFTRDGGSVEVHLSRPRGHVKIAIKDTGIGIPEADIAKLGRPFEQVENQFSKSHQGSGLGLAISRALWSSCMAAACASPAARARAPTSP